MGGINNIGGLLTLASCTLDSNKVLKDGGGVSNLDGTTRVSNSTFSMNSATGTTGSYGGALFNLFNGSAVMTVANSTLVNNSASSGGGISAQALVTLNNTIVTTSLSGGDLSGTFAGSHNLVRDGSGVGLTGTITPDPILGPLLGQLADNGGPTRTFALLAGSPAINAGANALAVDALSNPLLQDQRGPGFARILGSNVDIGAFEYSEAPSLIVTTTADIVDPTDSQTSLREAVAYANSRSAMNAITFAIPTTDPGYNPVTGAFTITLTGGELLLGKNMAIIGPGANHLIVSGNHAGRVFEIDTPALAIAQQGGQVPDSGITAAISGLTIEDGFSPTYGGGIFNNGTLSIVNCTVSDNTSSSTRGLAGDGGGVENFGSLMITGCNFSGNLANYGGGILASSGSSRSITARSPATLPRGAAPSSGGALLRL